MPPDDRIAHLKGVLRLIDPAEKDRARRQLLSTPRDRQRWLDRLRHHVSMHPQFTVEPPRGERSAERLCARLRALGAGSHCYVVASDNADVDDTFQLLTEVLASPGGGDFGHGTILSCVPGRLAVFRTAWPHKHLIVHRTD